MEIRRLAENDGPLLRAAVQTLLTDQDQDRPGSAAEVPHLERALADARCYFLVGLDRTEPIGLLSAYAFPMLQHDGSAAYLYDIAVRADRRRRGIATRLVTHLKELCRTDGIGTIWVGTSLDNAAARRTFESTGAVRVSETYVEYVYDLDNDP